MIVRQDHGDTLMDASSIARITGRQRATIRARATQVACDARSKRALYDALEAIRAVENVKPRARRNHAA